MKKNKLIILCTFLGLLIVAFSCRKIDIPNSNQIEVAFINTGSGYITSDVTLNPGASFSIDFTVNSPNDMEYVYVYRNTTTEVYKDQLTTNKRFFRGTKSFTADAAPGVYTYSIVAKDKAGIFLGQKNIVVTVTNDNDFYFYTVKKLLVPDTTAKTNPSYFSLSTAQSISYTDAASKSNLIDFGYFWDPELTGTPPKPKGHTIYSLNISPIPAPLSIYNISTFTKNATLLKVISSPSFANLNSSAILQSTGLANLGSGTSTSINQAVGKVILFKTVAGKYGAIQVNYANQENPNKETFIVMDIKIQK